MPSGRWWQNLQSNFYACPEPFTLERKDRFQIGATAMLDAGLRTAAASVLTASGLARAINPVEVWRDLTDARMYMDMFDQERGREFFPQPPRDVVFRERRPRTPHFRPSNGRCVDLVWESHVSPFNPRIRERYLSHTRNCQARARYWRHDGAARPTLVFVHGFVADAYLFNEWFFQLQWFYERLGLDVVCFTLPFHGSRRGLHSAFSGQFFFSQGVSWIAEAFRQAVTEFRALLSYFEGRGVPGVGVSGISLGGYTTALLASLEPRLAFAIPNVPVVSMPDLLLEWNPLGAIMRLGMLASDISVQEVRHMMAIHCPLSYEPVIPKDRLMIIGGVGDRLAPPKHARLLWDHWDRPSIHWFPGNHIIHLDQGQYLRYIAKFLGRIGFLPRGAAPVPAEAHAA